MFPFWLVLGIAMILAGIFSRQILTWLGSRPNSEVFTNPGRKQSSRIVEQIGRWLMLTLGLSFIVLGFGETLPVGISPKILFGLLGLAGLMLIAMIAITVANWKTR